MTLHQKIFGLITSILILSFILNLVRKRKIKEEYTWLWVVTGILMVALIIKYDILIFVSRIIGAEDPLTTLFLFGFLFLVAINIHYSIKISSLSEQIKKIAQHAGILSKKLDDEINKNNVRK